MAKKENSFNNLIDECMKLNEAPDVAGKAPEQFIRILSGYFFGSEAGLNRGLELFLNNLEPPDFLKGAASLFEIDIDRLKSYINGNSLNDSLGGKIMLSPQYLKAFYPHNPPSFNKLPEDVRFELMDLIKEKNGAIIAAFEKMMMDRGADRKRKVLTLVALIIKNVHLRTGSPLNRLPKPAEEIIRSIFNSADEVFTAGQRQMADLRDDTKIKQLVKTFFMVKQFKEITDVADLFREELERYKKRTVSAAG
jgi:hypothetical protein